MAEIAFDAGAAAAALLRLAVAGSPRPEKAGEQARTLFLVWLMSLPAGTEREAARAARPDLCGLAPDPIGAELLALIDRVLALPSSHLPGPRRRQRMLH